ncbi:MAG TPA: DUF4426 domain-containing protein [Woeseiaceae bacterium]|nr:DUF4426 domain-containing protein [Woeseiaceae bacterium]
MRPASTTAAVSVLSLLAACGGPGPDATVPQAEPAGASSMDIGEHIVHYSAQVTAQLPVEIARLYDIVRSKDRAMLSVSVLAEATGTSVPATVSVKTVNLTGQLKTVNMRRIDEEEAIYYIGETPVANRETLIFDISVKPEGVEQPTEIRFKRQFFTDQ